MQRKLKVAIALLLVAASALLIVWNTSAESAPPALGVADAKYRALERPDSEATVRGDVVEGSIIERDGRLQTFVVGDGAEQLRVVYNQTPPDNFGAKQVVVRGTLDLDPDGVPVLRATAIQVGCASKY